MGGRRQRVNYWSGADHPAGVLPYRSNNSMTTEELMIELFLGMEKKLKIDPAAGRKNLGGNRLSPLGQKCKFTYGEVLASMLER
jgi:hypothetical protein